MQKTAAMKRAGAVMGVTIAVLCVLLVAFSYYHATRATISPYGELSLWDTIVMNSDIIMGLVFLAACSVPFFLKFERRKPRAREMVPLAVMAALGVVGNCYNHGRCVRAGGGLYDGRTHGVRFQFYIWAGAVDAMADVLLGHDRLCCWAAAKIGLFWARKAAAAFCFACVGQDMPREHIARGYAALCARHK